eukprot:CAMPEP_0177157930 /NCGR_PEP_ID=MMETSP0367-20130122/3526_1 /TAXON_ID=447022 ORGANISM="Scrippsiella hangoei-like, Strain SHHI-4" /NCGR_SAMPLE_ID=MMETSP0367 /ASSEMBLY_ACC=CAM_ASM_000362 /LENGTH=53 /DNA_ID=CAMNT_0018603491 /DNA_START=74 /DNA_END=232 /DNA_ORIENTATION=-
MAQSSIMSKAALQDTIGSGVCGMAAVIAKTQTRPKHPAGVAAVIAHHIECLNP